MCLLQKPITDFYFNDAKHRKRTSRCKSCVVDMRLEKRGIVRKSPYRQRITSRNQLNYCSTCGKRTGHARDKVGISLCSVCALESLVEEFGGVAWKKRLQANAKCTKRLRDTWSKKMDALASSIRSRAKAIGECETKRRTAPKGMDWSKRLARLSRSRQLRDEWLRAMDTKTRNWRRKQRKVLINVQGDIKEATAVVTRAGFQMRFKWANTDAR